MIVLDTSAMVEFLVGKMSLERYEHAPLPRIWQREAEAKRG